MNGTSIEVGLPEQWSAESSVLWRQPLPGPAASTPIVWGNRIFLTSTKKGGDELLVLAFDREGRKVWERPMTSEHLEVKVPQLAHETSGASPSPVTDGKHLWALFGNGLLACLDLEGELVWQVDLSERYGTPSLYFGLATSPLLHGERLYFQLLHDGAQLVVALDKGSGREVWKQHRPTDATAESVQAYTTPVPFRSAEGGDLILIHGADYLTAHRPEDGKEVWRFGTINPEASYNSAYRLVATPAVDGDLIVVPTAQRGPVFGLRPGSASGTLSLDSEAVRWTLERANPDVPSPLVHEGLVYLIDNKGILRVVEASSGKETHLERLYESPHRASPVYSDGKIYAAAADGTVTVLEPGPEPKVLARNELGEQLSASPSVSNGILYLRTYEALYAIGTSGEGRPAP
jgi:outer membrane protein assembly factor BamB